MVREWIAAEVNTSGPKIRAQNDFAIKFTNMRTAKLIDKQKNRASQTYRSLEKFTDNGNYEI